MKTENIIGKTEEMLRYEKETKKYAIWRGIITEGFKKWQKGEKIYNRSKERISLYVPEETKSNWQKFIKENRIYPTFSKLIRESVKAFIIDKSTNSNSSFSKRKRLTIGDISHALKEPLTSIKGYSQLLIENYREKLKDEVLDTIKNIFEQSILLENKIIDILDNVDPEVKKEKIQYDFLLIEDDIPTIDLLKHLFNTKGYTCKGVTSGLKGLEEIKNSPPKIILLDIIMPVLSGDELCKKIKSDKNLKHIPIYFLTAIPGAEVEKKIEETGANGYILKPFNFTDFNFLFNILEKENSS